MLKEIPKATKGTGSNQYQKAESAENHEEVKFSKPKAEVIEELGFKRQQASQFQQMAEHEDVVLEAISEARENDDIIFPFLWTPKSPNIGSILFLWTRKSRFLLCF